MDGDKNTHGIIHWIGMVMVAIAVPLDLLATIVRMLEGAISFKFPALYTAWEAHTDPTLALFYYIIEGIALVAVPIGASAAALLTFPLIRTIRKRIRAAEKNRNKAVKREMLARLYQERKHYYTFIALAIIPLALFSVSFFTTGYKVPTKTITQTVTTTVHGKKVTKAIPVVVAAGPDLSGLFAVASFIADVSAPVLSMIVVMNMEGEANEVEAQERAMHATDNIIVESIATVAGAMKGGKLSVQQAQMLRAGTEGDLMGAVEAITDRPENQRLYSITDLCHRFDCSTDKDDPGRKWIYRRVTEAAKRYPEIHKVANKGWMVPGKLLDDIFADEKPPAPSIRLVPDRQWTPRPVDVASEAS